MNRPADIVSVAAVAYLTVPALIFLGGWLEPVPGIAAALVTAYAAGRAAAALGNEGTAATPGAIAWLAALAFVWAALGGAGHLVYANLDWHTRDAVYADLIVTAWPPAYGMTDGTPLILRSAVGFFLAPATLAKAVGIGWAPLLLLAWSALGALLFLRLLPLPSRAGVRLVALALVVVGFSGMDYPAILAVHGHAPMFPLPLEWWRPWTYTSLSAQLFWAPNHALPLWLGTALILRHRANPALAGLMVVLLPILLLWTPFAVGLLPWAAWALWRQDGPLAATLRRTGTLPWIAAGLVTTLALAYLSRPGAVGPALRIENSTGASTAAGWPLLDIALSYIQFVAFEFVVLALLLRPRATWARSALAIAVAILLALPLIRIGPSNDWLLRISTPCLVVLLWLTLREFDRPAAELRRCLRLAALAMVIALGAITPGFEIARAVLWPRTPPNFGQSLVQQQRGNRPAHYVGRLDLPILRAAFRTPSPVPEGEARRRALHPSPR